MDKQNYLGRARVMWIVFELCRLPFILALMYIAASVNPEYYHQHFWWNTMIFFLIILPVWLIVAAYKKSGEGKAMWFRHDAPKVYDGIESLMTKLNIKRPQVYFRKLTEIGVTAGIYPWWTRIIIDPRLREILNAEQMEAVIAHELAHKLHMRTWKDFVRIFLSMVHLSALFHMCYVLSGDYVSWYTAIGIFFLYTWLISYRTLGIPLLYWRRLHEYAADMRACSLIDRPYALAEALIILNNENFDILSSSNTGRKTIKKNGMRRIGDNTKAQLKELKVNIMDDKQYSSHPRIINRVAEINRCFPTKSKTVLQ